MTATVVQTSHIDVIDGQVHIETFIPVFFFFSFLLFLSTWVGGIEEGRSGFGPFSVWGQEGGCKEPGFQTHMA